MFYSLTIITKSPKDMTKFTIFENVSDVDFRVSRYIQYRWKDEPKEVQVINTGKHGDGDKIPELIKGTNKFVFASMLENRDQLKNLMKLLITFQPDMSFAPEIHVISLDTERKINVHADQDQEFKNLLLTLRDKYRIYLVREETFQLPSEGGAYFKKQYSEFDWGRLCEKDGFFLCVRPLVVDNAGSIRDLMFDKPSVEEFNQFLGRAIGTLNKQLNTKRVSDKKREEIETDLKAIKYLLKLHVYTD